MLSGKRTFILITTLMMFGGCSHYYVPDASTFKLDAIKEFSSSNSISILNAQTSTKNVLLATNMGHRFYGNLQSWTETAITITQRELINRGMKIEKDVPKILNLSIESAEGTFGAWVLRFEITLKVETGDGYVQTYLGDNRSPATLFRAADGAVMRAVAEMLKDEHIIAYLVN